ncbi:hypothetical protein ACFTXO_06060 [Streptomyces sp. NPDC057067]|uniref:hypothetical protein n=1 Tax=Streptomyces TaxID=1883 RepID=UPI00100EDC19|nr:MULTISPECIES: hypothetical protein [Streptomyces]MBL1289041.1 hypothetical protein [Streptomyces silvae]
MTQIDDVLWSRSLRAMFGEGMFAAVGARRRDDWRLDALDVMQLRTDDPRGWPRIVTAPAGSNYGAGSENPFGAVTPGDFDAAFPVARSGAEQIMVTLQADWFQTEGIQDFDAREAELMSHARVVLERFGADALFFTNAVSARENPHADMFGREGVYEGFTSYVMDCGVIAVSAAEVGIFWGFTTD